MFYSPYWSAPAAPELWQQGNTDETGANAPVIWVPVLVPYWELPQPAFSDDATRLQAAPLDAKSERGESDEESAGGVASCSRSTEESGGASDTYSDASTDVGEDEDLEDIEEEDIDDIEQESPKAIAKRPSFFKPNKQQRVDQLKRLVDEFCNLDFDSADASSQGGLVLRMLTTLKSLGEETAFYESDGRCQEKRSALLGLSKGDEDAIKDVIVRVDTMCDKRLFHSAFDVMKEIAPRLREERVQVDPASVETCEPRHTKAAPESGKTSPSGKQLGAEAVEAEDEAMASKELMSPEELEAMKERRLQKRLRQRQERREHRATDRAVRSAQRWQPPRGQSSSSSSMGPCHASSSSDAWVRRNGQ